MSKRKDLLIRGVIGILLAIVAALLGYESFMMTCLTIAIYEFVNVFIDWLKKEPS